MKTNLLIASLILVTFVQIYIARELYKEGIIPRTGLNLFVVLLVTLDLCAVVWEFKYGRGVKAWYWASAGSITLSTLWMK